MTKEVPSARQECGVFKFLISQIADNAHNRTTNRTSIAMLTATAGIATMAKSATPSSTVGSGSSVNEAPSNE